MRRPPGSRRRVVLLLVGLLLLGGASWIGVRATRSTVAAMGDAAPRVPTAPVVREPLERRVHMTGEVRALGQQAMMAPPVGTALRILSIVDSGVNVAAGDVVLSFDPADQRYALEQAESELLEAEQNILRRRAEIGAQRAGDEVALLTARFNVRRAELDAAVDRDLIPANEHEIRQVSLEEARRALTQTEQDVASRSAVHAAGLSVLEESRAKAQLAADRARQSLQMLELTAETPGVVAVRDNLDSTTVLFSGMTLPAYRVGDLVSPGRPVIDIFDVSGLEIRARVPEQQRADLESGQAVAVRSNSIPGLDLPARIRTVSGLGQPQRFKGPQRWFDVTISLDRPEPRLRPGTTVSLEARGARIDDALVIPRQAIFDVEGKSVVYVEAAGVFEPREIKVIYRGESRAAVEGIEVGAQVTLVQPAAMTAAAQPPPAGRVQSR
jgi:HlyD family secretion protein